MAAGQSTSRGHRRRHIELVPHLTRDPPAGMKAPLREVDGAGRRDPEHGGAARTVVGIQNAHGGVAAFPLEIEAVIPEGSPDSVVRTVTENSRTLKFSSQGFETD